MKKLTAKIKRLITAAVLLSGSAAASAGIIFQTADLPVAGVNTPASEWNGLPPNSFIEGPVISHGQWVGAGFSLDSATLVESVEIFGTRDVGSGYFAAITAVNPHTGLPDFSPLSIEANALASVIFDLGATHGHQLISTAFDIVLAAGDYALIVGAGCFPSRDCEGPYTQATGAGGVTYVFASDSATFIVANDFEDGQGRWFESGTIRHGPGEPATTAWYMALKGQAIAVPEPSTLALLGIGLLGAQLVRRKV